LSLFAWAASCPLLFGLRVHFFNYLGILLVLIVVIFVVLFFIVVILFIFILIIIFPAPLLALPDDQALADRLLGATDQSIVLGSGTLPIHLL
jgi:uncharacterized membrane protein YqiK